MYNYLLLTTVEACDLAMEGRTTLRDGLVVQKSKLQLEIEQGEPLAAAIPQELSAVDAMISGNESALPMLPEGRMKRKLEMELNSLENQRHRLVNKSEHYGPLAMLDKEEEVRIIDATIAEIDATVALIETRKAELLAAA